MKKLLILLTTFLAVMLGIGALYAQTTGPGMMDQERGSRFRQGYGPPKQGGWDSPYNGALQQGDRNGSFGRMGRGWGMSPDQRGRGWGMGSGRMGRGWGMSPDQRGRGWGMGSGCR